MFLQLRTIGIFARQCAIDKDLHDLAVDTILIAILNVLSKVLLLALNRAFGIFAACSSVDTRM